MKQPINLVGPINPEIGCEQILRTACVFVCVSEMGNAAREQLSRSLNDNLNTIHETFQVLDQTPHSSLEKVSWNEVIQMGERVSKQATTVGMLYTGDTTGVKALEENMSAYFNMLQGLLLLSHGSSMGAGSTLSSCIHKAVKQVVDGSFMLLREAVSLYGSPNNSQKNTVPQLVGAVWEACSSLKKTPSTNVTAIGRVITQTAVSIKDVLREIKELKESSPGEEISTGSDDNKSEGCVSCDGDLGNDGEMKIVRLTITIVSEILVVIKELIRSITGLLQAGNNDDSAISVDALEKLLKLCRGIGVQVDDLGACLYPPQEICAIKVALGKISSFGDEMEVEMRNIGGFTDGFSKSCSGLKSLLRELEGELDASDLAQEMESLVVSDY